MLAYSAKASLLVCRKTINPISFYRFVEMIDMIMTYEVDTLRF